MKNKSLAAQFRHTFLMTLAACLTATVLTYVLAAACLPMLLTGIFYRQIIISSRFPMWPHMSVKKTGHCCPHQRKMD